MFYKVLVYNVGNKVNFCGTVKPRGEETGARTAFASLFISINLFTCKVVSTMQRYIATFVIS